MGGKGVMRLFFLCAHGGDQRPCLGWSGGPCERPRATAYGHGQRRQAGTELVPVVQLLAMRSTA